MSITYKEDETIVASDCNIIVNPINCVGVMTDETNLEFKSFYPKMYEDLRYACLGNEITIGTLWVYEIDNTIFVHIPIKKHWRDEADSASIKQGLFALKDLLFSRPNLSVATPLLGYENGGIGPDYALKLIKSILADLPNRIVIYGFSN